MGHHGMLPPMTPKLLKSSIGIATPPAVKARVEILEQQNEMLVNEKGMLMRKHKGDLANLEGQLAQHQQRERDTQDLLRQQRSDFEARLRAAENASNAGWQQEKQSLETQIKLADRTASLASAEHNVRVADLERRLAQAEKQKAKHAHVAELAASAKADLRAQLEEQASLARIAAAEHAATTRSLSALRQRHRSTLQGLEEREATQAEASRQLNTQSSEHTALVARYDTLKTASQKTTAALEETKESLEQAESELEQLRSTVEDQKKGRDKLQKTIALWKERCEDKQKELDAWLREEKNEGGGYSQNEKELRALKSEVRNAKAELITKTDEISELTTEQDRLRQQVREREKEVRELRRAHKDGGGGVSSGNGDADEEISELKKTLESKDKDIRKLSRAIESRDKKIAELESEVSKVQSRADKMAATKPTKTFSAVDIAVDAEIDDDEAGKSASPVAALPREKSQAEAAKKRKAPAAVRPLGESNSALVVNKPKTAKDDLKKMNEIFAKPTQKKAVVSDDEAETGVDAPVVKKKRKLGGAGAKTAFVWDQTKNPEGPIPLYLSPLKKSTVPRAGFGAASKSLLSRF